MLGFPIIMHLWRLLFPQVRLPYIVHRHEIGDPVRRAGTQPPVPPVGDSRQKERECRETYAGRSQVRQLRFGLSRQCSTLRFACLFVKEGREDEDEEADEEEEEEEEAEEEEEEERGIVALVLLFFVCLASGGRE